MAVERDFELLDDYISNRLRGQDKTAFEQKMKSDLELKAEYQLQQKLVEGIKSARVAELKSLLNNVAVPSVGGETALFTKLVAGFVVAGLIGAGVYLYTNQEEAKEANEQSIVEESKTDATQPQDAIEKKEITPAEEDKSTSPLAENRETRRARHNANKKAAKAIASITAKEEEKVAEKRKLEVFDPTRENDANTQNNTAVASGANEESSSIAVETDNTNKKYTFNYQFKGDKLILYGSFEKNLYEILEFFSENKRTAFLYYKDSYYLLNDENEKIKPLSPITDPVLIKKLKEYRGN